MAISTYAYGAALPPSPTSIATTRNSLPSSLYGAGGFTPVQPYQVTPNIPTPAQAIGTTTGAVTANAASLENVSQILNRINQQAQQQANLARTGGNPAYDQAILGNIYRGAQGYVNPETVREAEAAAAQQWGGAGFGVDTPAWQSAVRRALGLTREQQQEQAARDYEAYLAGHPSAPIVDVSRYTMTPEQYTSDVARQQDAEYRAAALRQQAALQEQELAERTREFNIQQQLAREQWDVKRRALLPMGYNELGEWIPGGKYQSGVVGRTGQFTPGPFMQSVI